MMVYGCSARHSLGVGGFMVVDGDMLGCYCSDQWQFYE